MVKPGDDKGVLDQGERSLRSFAALASRSLLSKAVRELDTFEMMDMMRGKKRSETTLTLGAQATNMARWFSTADHIMALAYHPIHALVNVNLVL
jgi:hypothetical protein